MPFARAFAAILLLTALVGAASKQPSVRAVYRPTPPSIAVTATDAVGLDSLQLLCPALDLTYTTQLSRASADKRFERSFPLGEVFPGLDDVKETVRVTVTVRNTRGVAVSMTVAVPPGKPGKPN